MEQDRRTFLKTTGIASAMAGGLIATPAAAQQPSAAPRGPAQPLPKGMTFATIVTPRGMSLGVRTDKGVVDVAAAEAAMKTGAPTTIDDVIQQRGDLAALAALVSQARDGGHWIAEDAVKFGPCVTNPEKILCLGLNYRAHAAEANQQVPKVPILFNKYNSALNHHGGTIAVSKENAKSFDYETELVVVMGKTARNVSPEEALTYVLGYATGQDFSARDLQSQTSQWMVGKTGDGWGPVGPWLVTADQVDPHNLKIETRVNGELRQSSNTSNLIFNCSQCISFISKCMTLRPGDVIFTGTPEGVIAGYPKDKQVWLKAGDKIVSSIEKLGDLEFTLT
jgi:2-keto-4-pentenoate hydratase/2-oxohepta-3-ene-1,7-dioic acid hydratase in catechol pathway